ncbi:16S rRNA (guanine527-N7)-methyltransferase [Roseovarius litoreus]|uniref:Ribosomal RNA small subunit methyltransferase G n=1 Tax=Roseovarius litoreus TaxID=1155722 RepID=A0A1M7BEX0_9RHOB|nr:16S rRNA (guanine(527)-N(7))-methyltransferase RsmG [Roseovarius litoreus]SHL53474.1 16S rRNA (guanine527-N7)-methyltransferase [Roseovarius litoreus]
MSDAPDLNVSRETLERLTIYEVLLRKWTPRINLVARSTLPDLWQRHFVDSIQIYDLAPHPVDHWVDLGSGAGFPGLLMAILSLETGSPKRTTLVESDVRKCVFLNTVIRETGARADVINDRIENIPPLEANVLSARALADLTTLLGFAERHMRADGTAIFPKGENWQKEVEAAQTAWTFTHRLAKSKTETGPVIMTITGVARV